MNAALTATCVEQAVHQFYHNAGLQQQQLHQWLTVAQFSHEAWSFSWELLSSQKSIEVQFFGANTLHIKISRNWSEVPLDQYENLRSRLLQKIIELCCGPKVIITRLCVALSSLILHMCPEHWPDPVQQLISTFQTIPDVTEVQKCHVLLEILRVLPEEFFSANLSQIQRVVLKNELSKCLSNVLPLLHSLQSSTAPVEVQRLVLQCFSSWIEFGIPVNQAESNIMQTFQCLRNSELFDTAVDTLVNFFSHPMMERYPNTMQKYLPCILSLQEMLMKARESQDMDVCQGIGQVVVAYAENHTNVLLDASLKQDLKDNAMNFINMVLTCTSIPGHFPVEEGFSNMFFTFWYRLQDGIQDSEQDRCRQLLPIYQPVFLTLIQALMIKVQYPDDEEYTTWTSDEKEQFRCYRQDIGDTMMYSFSILREPLLGFLCNTLTSATENVKEVRWQLLEAIFFMFASVAESVDLEESVYLPNLLNILPKLPFNNIKLISSALYMIGSYGEWINCHPECLNCVIPLMLQGLQNPEIATSATMSLKDVTRENLDHIQPYVSQILSASQQAFQNGNLKARDSARLMSAVGQVLSVIKYEEIMRYLSVLLTPHIVELENLVTQRPSTSVKGAILAKLSILGSLFSALDTQRDKDENPQPKTDDPKPVAVVLQQLAPVLHSLITKWIVDTGVIEVGGRSWLQYMWEETTEPLQVHSVFIGGGENLVIVYLGRDHRISASRLANFLTSLQAICDMIKHALRTLLDDFAPLTKDVSDMLIQMYQVIPNPAILDLAKQLIVMHQDDPKLSPVVMALLGSLCGISLTLFQKDAQNYTDVVEGFMNLMAQVLKKSKGVLLSEPCIVHIPSLYQIGIKALELPENQTVKATCSFLAEFLSAGEGIPVIQNLVQGDGHLLLDKILRAIGGEAARGLVEYISDLLLALNKYCPENMPVWLNQLIKQDGYPSSKITTADKELFVKSVLREKVNKRKIREISKEFSLKCRGLFGSEYAANSVQRL